MTTVKLPSPFPLYITKRGKRTNEPKPPLLARSQEPSTIQSHQLISAQSVYLPMKICTPQQLVLPQMPLPLWRRHHRARLTSKVSPWRVAASTVLCPLAVLARPWSLTGWAGHRSDSNRYDVVKGDVSLGWSLPCWVRCSAQMRRSGVEIKCIDQHPPAVAISATPMRCNSVWLIHTRIRPPSASRQRSLSTIRRHGSRHAAVKITSWQPSRRAALRHSNHKKWRDKHHFWDFRDRRAHQMVDLFNALSWKGHFIPTIQHPNSSSVGYYEARATVACKTHIQKWPPRLIYLVPVWHSCHTSSYVRSAILQQWR